jgi:Divergent InlB B-repeat domain
MIRSALLVIAVACLALVLGGSHALGAGTVDVRITAPSIDGALVFSDGSWSWRCVIPTCTVHTYPGRTLTVIAQSGAASAFQSWSGACSGTQAGCSIAVGDSPVFASARFSRQRLWLPTFGAGTISVSTPGWSCGNGCADYTTGQQVVLRTTSAQGWRLTAWGGDCAGVRTDHGCIVTMNRNLVVSATFEPLPSDDCPPGADCSPVTTVKTFTVHISGQGAVIVPRINDLRGLSCRAYASAQCSFDRPYEHWISVTAVGVHFLGWNDARCRGQGPVCRFYNGSSSYSRGFDLTARFG